MLDKYKNMKEELLTNIRSLKTFCSSRGSSNLAENLSEIEEKLVQDRFHLVILGQFKRGKSTLINSILGDYLLPTSVVPLTSIVTILKYGEEEKIEVVLNKGNRKAISRDELEKYVTERGNPGNEKQVKQVEICYPSDYLKDGVCIIDTPGVGSTFENNTEMTYNYLPKVDAALFLLAVDPPISQSETQFLRDIQKHVEKIFFIQNKIDYLGQKEQMESMNFSKQVIEQILGTDDIRIYPLSAKMALEAKKRKDNELLAKSRLPEFDRVLGDFLTEAKGKTVLRSALNATRKLLQDEELAITLQSKAIATPLETLEQKIKIFQEKMEEIRQDRDNSRFYFEGEIKRAVDMLDRDLELLKSKEIPRLLEELIKKGQEYKHKGITEYVKLMDSTLHDGIKSAFDNWLVQEEERLNVEYGKIAKRYSEKTNQVIESILTASSELFDLNIEKIVTEESISTDSSLYLMTGDPPKFFDVEGAFDFFSQRILPRKISQKMVLKDLKKKLPEKIDQNCGRVRWDFMDRIKRSFMNFRWDLNQKIDTTEQSIAKAIQKALEIKKQSAEEIKKAQDQILKQLDELNSIKKALTDLEGRVELL